MRVNKLLFLLFLVVPFLAGAQQTYFTNVANSQFKTLQVGVAGQLISEPYIPLGTPKQIQISFDQLGDDGFTQYAYSVIHCDGNWTQSMLTPLEYMNGFQGSLINNYNNSMGTTQSYTNYQLLLPNSDVQFKVSGNYAIQIYNENTPDEILMTACFSIVEPVVVVNGAITGNTNIDTNQSHQQVNFTINYPNFPINYPETDLKVFVYQDSRRDNMVTNLQPMNISGSQVTYAYNNQLVFPGGNEYRRMEFLSDKYVGMHVQNITWHNPYYNVELMTDYKRNNQVWQYDQDQDGRFFINCSACTNPSYQSDYFIVHFTLSCDELQGGDVYLNGDLVYDLFTPASQMSYNSQANRYEKAILLKQGSYNYQYLFVPNGSTVGQTGPIEGNFYETQNEYSIYVYYRPFGARYDRLIGAVTLRNPMSVF